MFVVTFASDGIRVHPGTTELFADLVDDQQIGVIKWKSASGRVRIDNRSHSRDRK